MVLDILEVEARLERCVCKFITRFIIYNVLTTPLQ